MGIGESQREIHLALDEAAAFDAVVTACDAIGKVLESSADMGTVTVRTRYGLQRVKLRISVVPDDRGSRVNIGAFADDIWGGGARKGTDKFVRALEESLPSPPP